MSKWKLESSSLKEQLEVSKAKFVEETAKQEKAKSEAVSKLSADIEALKSDISERKGEIESLKNQRSEDEKKNTEQVQNLRKDLSERDEQLSKANHDLAQEQSKGQRLGQELKSATQQILELQESLDNLQVWLLSWINFEKLIYIDCLFSCVKLPQDWIKWGKHLPNTNKKVVYEI